MIDRIMMAVVSLPARTLDVVHAVTNHSGISGFLTLASRKRDMKSLELYGVAVFSASPTFVLSRALASANFTMGESLSGSNRRTKRFLIHNLSSQGICPTWKSFA